MPNSGNRGYRQLLEQLSRREMLGMSVAGAAFLAGCAGDGDGGDGGDSTPTMGSSGDPVGVGNTDTPGDDTPSDDPTDTPTGSSEILDRTMRHHTYVPPSDTNLNPFSPQASWHNRLYTNRLFSLWDSTRGELSARNGIGSAEDWGYRETDGTPEFWVRIRDGMKWSAGPEADSGLHNSDFVAQDIVNQNKLNRLMIPESDRPENPIETGFYAEDDRTAVWELRPGEFNEISQRINILTQWFWFDTHRNGPLTAALEDLESASTENERQNIRTNVIQSKDMGLLEKPVSGPWRPVDFDNQRILFELNTDDLAASTNGGPLNFSNFELIWLGDTSFVRAMGENEIDVHQDPVPAGSAPSDNMHEIDAAELGGSKIHINYYDEGHEKAFMNEPKFRWALAHAINRPQAARNGGRLVQPVFKQTGDEDSQVENLLPDLYPKLRGYQRLMDGGTREEDLELATQYLEDIGCSKNGNQWMDPNGNELVLPLLAINLTLWQPQARTVASNLRDFGITVELSLKDETTVTAQAQRGDYTAMMDKWGGFAYYPLNFDQGWEERGTSNEVYKTPDVLTAPETIGDFESSSMVEIDGPKLYSDIQREPDPEAANEMARQLAWAHNYNLPSIQIGSSGSGTPINTNGKWNWPAYGSDTSSGQDWSSWVTTDDSPLWAVDGPENAIFHGHGGGLRANPDYEG